MRFYVNFRFSALSFLLLFNFLLFLLPNLLTLVFGAQVDNAYGLFLYLLGGLNPAWVAEGDVWRMVTSTFLHVDLIHILANMLALYNLGRLVQTYYGGKLLFAFYIFTGFVGSLFSLIFLPGSTVGASGAVFGIMGVLLAGSWKGKKQEQGLPFDAKEILPLAIYSFLISLNPAYPVNNWSHLGGFLGGLIAGYFVKNKVVSWSDRKDYHIENGIFGLNVAVFVLSYVFMVVSLVRNIFLI